MQRKKEMRKEKRQLQKLKMKEKAKKEKSLYFDTFYTVVVNNIIYPLWLYFKIITYAWKLCSVISIQYLWFNKKWFKQFQIQLKYLSSIVTSVKVNMFVFKFRGSYGSTY